MWSVVFPRSQAGLQGSLDARGIRGRHRTQLAASPALLSPTHSLTHSTGAINVSKGGTWHTWRAGCASPGCTAISLQGEAFILALLALIAHRLPDQWRTPTQTDAHANTQTQRGKAASAISFSVTDRESERETKRERENIKRVGYL